MPTKLTTIDAIKTRQQLYQHIRYFFEQRQVMEIETPILSPYGSTDVHIDSLTTTDSQQQCYYLHTSPEFMMKRLLAKGIGDCFQLAKVFRNESQGRHHRQEFTLLEWYRLGFSMAALIDEVTTLVKIVCPTWSTLSVEQLTYHQAFAQIGVDPHRDDLSTLQRKTIELNGYTPNLADDRDEWLDFLLVTQIEPTLGIDKLTFLTHYPASMAALAKKTTDEYGNTVAKRFELYYNGIELANGFDELTNADEQKSRFIADNQQRKQRNKPIVPMDTNLIAALQRGLPACAGVALGIDRLLMFVMGVNHIDDVMID